MKPIFKGDVQIGEGSVVEEFCIIGTEGKTTVIGNNAIIRSHTVIYGGNTIGDDFQTGNFATLREDNTIGNNVSIGTKSDVQHHVTIEDNVRIHTQAFIPEYTTLKKSAWIGPNVVLTNALYPQSPAVKDNLIGPTVCEGAKIGANSTILPGIVIGKNALVGAGSVVTKNVDDNAVVCGNPAKKTKNTSDLCYTDGNKAYL
jgi:acetyltransferase-like isoleucine patch superfamily enzyme